jgi:tetratricopeptide (TPR) repeat protein
MSNECLSCGHQYPVGLASCPQCGSRESISGAGTADDIDRLFDGLDAQQDSAGHSHKGGEYFMMGDFDNAAAEFLAAVEADPGSANDHENLGVTLCKLGRYAEAIPYLETALQLQPDKQTAAEFLSEARHMSAPVRQAHHQPAEEVEICIRAIDGPTAQTVEAIRQARADGARVRVSLDVSEMMDSPELIKLVELVEQEISMLLTEEGFTFESAAINRVGQARKWWQFWKTPG